MDAPQEYGEHLMNPKYAIPTQSPIHSSHSIPCRCFQTGGYWRLEYYEDQERLAVLEFHTPEYSEMGAITPGSVGVRYMVLNNTACETTFRIRIGTNLMDVVAVDHETMHWFSPERARAIWNTIASSPYWKVAH